MIKLPKFRKYLRSKVSNFKTKVKNSLENIKENENLPKSKLKSALLGMTTVFTIFGVTMFGPKLAAVAKDVPKSTPGSPVCPTPSNPEPKPSKELVKALSGAAATVCGLAITSGSFLIGAVCGVIVVYGILKVQGK